MVQVSEWRTPRSFDVRLAVGLGEIPLPPLLRAIHTSGFRGPYTVEIFSDNVPDPLWQADLSQVIEESRQDFDGAWRAAFAMT